MPQQQQCPWCGHCGPRYPDGMPLSERPRAHSEEAESRRVSRENRLRALGFDEPSDEQRKENLALNVALRDWPKI